MVNNIEEYKAKGLGQTLVWSLFLRDNKIKKLSRQEKVDYLKIFHDTWYKN